MDLTVRLESVLISRDGESMLVSATLPDGRLIRDAQIPALGSREAVALYLLDHEGGYHTVAGFTGNVSVSVDGDWPKPAASEESSEEAASASEASSEVAPVAAEGDAAKADEAPADDASAADASAKSSSSKKAVALSDGGAGTSK
jgi:hypothetical protein